MYSNDDIQLVASKRHKETSLEHKTQWICCWLVARVLQVEIRFVKNQGSDVGSDPILNAGTEYLLNTLKQNYTKNNNISMVETGWKAISHQYKPSN